VGPPSYKLVYKPHELVRYLRTINHSYCSYKPTNLAIERGPHIVGKGYQCFTGCQVATKEQLPGSRPRRTRLPSGRRSLPGSDKNRRRWTLDLRMGEQKNMVSIVKYTMYMGNAMESIFEYIYKW
jgi:hypothetical protein